MTPLVLVWSNGHQRWSLEPHEWKLTNLNVHSHVFFRHFIGLLVKATQLEPINQGFFVEKTRCYRLFALLLYDLRINLIKRTKGWGCFLLPQTLWLSLHFKPVISNQIAYVCCDGYWHGMWNHIMLYMWEDSNLLHHLYCHACHPTSTSYLSSTQQLAEVSGCRVWMWCTCMSARPKNRQQGKVSQVPQVQQVCQHCLWAALNTPPHTHTHAPNPSTKSLTHHSFILFVMLMEAYISAEYVNRQHQDAWWGWEKMSKSIPVVCGCVILMKPINLTLSHISPQVCFSKVC